MIKAKFPNSYRRFLYSLVTLSWLSGGTFFALSRWFIIEGDFGPMKHPWQFPVLMLHGAAAFLMIFMFGFILASHVPITWKLKKYRTLGIAVICIISFQIISAYLLYYSSNETIRDIVANCHAAVGLLLPFVLAIHVIHSRRKRRATKKSMLNFS